MGMEDSQLMDVGGMTSVRDWWDALQQLYTRDSMVSKITLSLCLYHTQLLPGTSMAEHLLGFGWLVNSGASHHVVCDKRCLQP